MDWGVLGHEWAIAMLKQHIARQEVRHAYLFTGSPGVGRRSLALRFAQALICPDSPSPGEPCGVCRACAQLWRMQHTDLAVVQTEEDASNIKVEQIRNLQHTLSLAPYEAPYRAALLLNFQEATVNAQNAFLKTLEEAPEKAVLLLTADSAENLLPTIVSRCEVLRLRPLAVDRLESALQEYWHIPPDQARLLAHISGGRPGYALRLHEDESMLSQRQIWIEAILELLAATNRERLAFAERQMKNKDRQLAKNALHDMLLVWLSYWRDVFISATGASTPLVNIDYEDAIHRLGSQLDFQAAEKRASDLEMALAGLDENANPQLLLEVLLIDWPQVRLS
jgi:DNA polymerase-3 subunit delta'